MALVMEEFLPLSKKGVWNVMPSSVVIFYWESMGYVSRYFEGKAGCLYTARFYHVNRSYDKIMIRVGGR